MRIFILFPHQLFENTDHLTNTDTVYLIEEYLFFNQYKFHKQKLVFHRASMKCFEKYLLDQGFNVQYVPSTSDTSDIRKFIEDIDCTRLEFMDPVDNYLSRRVKATCEKEGISWKEHPTLSFINQHVDISGFFKPTKKKFHQTDFYKQQRKSRKILLDENGNPEGGKWAFDSENRKKYPAAKNPPSISYPVESPTYKEALTHIEETYPENYGQVEDQLYPIDFETSKDWLQQFLDFRFSEFGTYEDALLTRERILHHSVLSPLINIGLLTPSYVVEQILIYVRINKIAINNTEGIIRQIIGWREFIRGIYEVKGRQERTTNFWGFKRKLPRCFYEAKTGIEPVDNAIKKVIKTGYNHHIERLMVIGNFMLLCEIDPDEVYQWFMEMYIDAFDWVMVPNVYGMSQFADGGLMSTKPYISGSNYLLKMGDYKKGPWQKTWDGLFWRFMHVHREFFLSNPRLSMLIRTFDKMSEEKRNTHLEVAKDFLDQL